MYCSADNFNIQFLRPAFLYYLYCIYIHSYITSNESSLHLGAARPCKKIDANGNCDACDKVRVHINILEVMPPFK